MGFTPRLITIAGKDRTNGEEIALTGSGLRMDPGAGEPEIYLALNEPTYPRVRVRAGEVLRTPFSRVFVFHGSYGSGVGPLELIAMDDCDAIIPGGGRVVIADREGLAASVEAMGTDLSILTPKGMLLAGALPYYQVGATALRAAWAPTYFPELHGLDDDDVHVVQGASTGFALRLLRYRIAVSADASLAAAGMLSVQIGDFDGTDFGDDIVHEHRWYLPADPLTNAIGALDTGWTDLGPVGEFIGYKLTSGRSVAAKLSADLASGEVSVWAHLVDDIG